MGVAWGIIFPLGTIMIRFFVSTLPTIANAHWIIQLSGLCLASVALGLGVYASHGHHFSNARTIPL